MGNYMVIPIAEAEPKKGLVFLLHCALLTAQGSSKDAELASCRVSSENPGCSEDLEQRWGQWRGPAGGREGWGFALGFALV